MECATSTRQRQRSAKLTFTLFVSVLTQIFLSAYVGALSAENKERQNNDNKTNANYLLMVQKQNTYEHKQNVVEF